MPSKTPRRSITALVRGGVALAIAATALAGGVSPAAASDTAASQRESAVPASVVPKIRWTSCGSEFPAFQCATVEVPLDYDRPYGATTTIALTRLPAAKPASKIGTLFTNPGGPGGSGVDFVQSGAEVFYPQAVRNRFDILGFDPRGVSRSDPATCYPTAAEEQAALATAPGFPVTDAQVQPFLAAARDLARNCAATSPERFRHISTANVARDMDLLRRAVGDAKLSYAGYSYGTFLGATYAALFPNKIRALVLDGTLDPREYSGTAERFADVPVGNRIEQDRGGAQVFTEFLRQCRIAGAERCSLAALGDPATVARQTLDDLKSTPAVLTLPDGSTVEITYQTAVAAIYTTLYSPTGWSELADLITELHADPARAERRAAAVSPAVAAMIRRTEDYASAGGSLGSTCVDTRTPNPRAFEPAADRADRRFPDFGRYRTWVGLPCAYLKAAGIRDEDAYRGPWQQTTRTNVLVLGTRYDPATPYKNTRPYADLFRNASVVTLEGWGHTTLGQSTCTDARVASYLLEPNRKRTDLSCATDVVPFTSVPESEPTARRAAAAREVVPVQR